MEECRMNVDARDAETKGNIAMSRRRKREKQLKNGGGDEEGGREEEHIGVGQMKARRERTAPDVRVRKRRWE